MALALMVISLGFVAAATVTTNLNNCKTPLTTPLPDKELFGFLTDTDTNFSAFNYTTLTTIGAFREVPDTMLCLAHKNDVRVVLANGACPSLTDPGGASCPADINNTVAVTSWVNYWVNRTNALGVDGLNLDIEGGIMPEHRDDLTAAVSALRLAMREANPLSQLSMDSFCLPTDPTRSLNYDWLSLSTHVDFIFAMCYDMPFMAKNIYGDKLFHAAWPFPESPLSQASLPMIQRGLAQHVELALNVTDKVVLGLPWYGYEFNCTSNDPATQCISFDDWQEIKPRPSKEIDYKEIMSILPSASRKGLDDASQTKWLEYFIGGDRHQIWYDDADTLITKYQMAKDFTLRGIGFWTLDAVSYATEDDVQTHAMWQALDTFTK